MSESAMNSFFEVFESSYKGLKRAKNKPYAIMSLKPVSELFLGVKKSSVKIEFSSMGRKDSLSTQDLASWAAERGILQKEVGAGISFSLASGARNRDKLSVVVEIPLASEDQLSEKTLQDLVKTALDLILDNLTGLVEVSGSEVKAAEKPDVNGTAFALTFGKLSPICIENEDSGEMAEEEEELLSMAPAVLAGIDNPCVAFAKNVTVEFDGDLDDPDKFNKIQLTGFEGPGQNTAEDCSFGDFTIYGIASISDDYEDDDEEELLEDIFHALAINLSVNNYTIDFGNWEEYSVSLEACPATATPLSVQWTPDM